VRILFVALAALLVAAPAADAYRNPTPGRALALQLPGMHRAKVRRNIVYDRAHGLRMDVYRPRSARGRLPAVLLGGPSGFGRSSGQKMGWAQLIAASGLSAVAFDIRSDQLLTEPAAPSADVATALRYVRAHARALGIDGDRLCTLGFSIGTAPWHLYATMRDPQPWLRCNVVYYGPLDLQGLAIATDPDVAQEFSALTWLRRHGARIPPMLVVKAGREENAGINESIDRFAAAARSLHADVRVVPNASGAHGFDVDSRSTPRARAVIRETLRFLRARLSGPLRMTDSCLSAGERASAVRFFAVDDTRLIGVELGAGSRGVVLAHQGGGAPPNLCAWMPYARHLAELGYHVLAIDQRRFGSSGAPPVAAANARVDLDVLDAVEELRRRGATRILVVGASLGGTAAVAAAARAEPAVDGVISFAAPSSYGPLDTFDAVARVRAPSLFVSAVDDPGFAEIAQLLYDRSAAADKRVLIAPGAEHGAPVLEDPATLMAVDAWIAAHIS
jgi:dienelactone hydrolase